MVGGRLNVSGVRFKVLDSVSGGGGASCSERRARKNERKKEVENIYKGE